ncbi:hypothetical protein LTR67_011268 [Exophiala xenobiotica]
MAESTLLQYLTLPNPTPNCSKSSVGTNTFNAKWEPFTGLEDWADFNYDTLQRIPPMPETSPPLTELEKEIFTETTFETILEREIMPQVSAALRIAWLHSYSNHKVEDVAEIGRGGKARRGTAEEDDRYYADWAGIRRCQTTNFGYRNLCPGETKLASKWSTSKEGRRRSDYPLPFSQIQTYCGRQWGTRHGYIITPEELVVIRVSREPIGPGLAASRVMRNLTQSTRDQPSHSRTFSAETVSSELQAMSLDTGSSFSDDANPNIEYGPLQFKSIPWSAEGTGKMTVKLGLWWMHMETGKDLSVQHYPPSSSMSDHGQVQQVPGKARAPVSPGPASGPSGPKNKGKGPAKK